MRSGIHATFSGFLTTRKWFLRNEAGIAAAQGLKSRFCDPLLTIQA
jgi:hypothetical protein